MELFPLGTTVIDGYTEFIGVVTAQLIEQNQIQYRVEARDTSGFLQQVWLPADRLKVLPNNQN